MFRACARWATPNGHKFNLGAGKSAQLVSKPSATGPFVPEVGGETGFYIAGAPLLAENEIEYLGVPLNADGPTDTKLRARVRGAAAALASLRDNRLVVRDMSVHAARTLYKAFVSSVWTYACFLVPFTTASKKALDSVDAGFISATLARCTTVKARLADGSAVTDSKLAKCRALMRIDSPELLRQITAHQAVTSLLKTEADAALPQDIRQRARLAIAELPHVSTIAELVPDLANPWGPRQIRDARTEAWGRATAQAKRKIPPPGEGKAFFPAAMTLTASWARALAVRYLTNSFPIFKRPATAALRAQTGQREEKAVLSTAERDAVASLPILEQPAFAPGEEKRVTAALKVLRARDAWARYGCRERTRE